METKIKLELPKKYDSPKLIGLGNSDEPEQDNNKACRGSSGGGGRGGGCSWK